jgi:hypothetical protein
VLEREFLVTRNSKIYLFSWEQKDRQGGQQPRKGEEKFGRFIQDKQQQQQAHYL